MLRMLINQFDPSCLMPHLPFTCAPKRWLCVHLSDVQIEPWFNTPFTVETLPAGLLELWSDPPSVDPALHMPVCNEFIPHDFTIFTGNEEDDVFNYPRCLIDSAALKVWHKHERRFRAPRTSACFSIMFFPATKRITDAVFAQIYLIRLTSELNETIYLVRTWIFRHLKTDQTFIYLSVIILWFGARVFISFRINCIVVQRRWFASKENLFTSQYLYFFRCARVELLCKKQWKMNCFLAAGG